MISKRTIGDVLFEYLVLIAYLIFAFIFFIVMFSYVQEGRANEKTDVDAKIVIVGGFTSTAEQMKFLEEKFPNSAVIILQKYAPLEEAEEVFLKQLEELGLKDEPVVFIAFCWGGLIVKKISEDYPEKINIKKIITIATPSKGYSIAPRWVWRMLYGKMPAVKSKYPLFVIAGDKGEDRWFLNGSNDGTVELDSVLSVEADEIVLFPLSHLQLLHNEAVVEQIKLWVSN